MSILFTLVPYFRNRFTAEVPNIGIFYRKAANMANYEKCHTYWQKKFLVPKWLSRERVGITNVQVLTLL